MSQNKSHILETTQYVQNIDQTQEKLIKKN